FLTAPTPPPPYTLSLHDALPISAQRRPQSQAMRLEAVRELRHGRKRRTRPDHDRRRAALRPAVEQHNGLSSAPCDGERESLQDRSEEHTSELQSRSDLVCRLLLE